MVNSSWELPEKVFWVAWSGSPPWVTVIQFLGVAQDASGIVARCLAHRWSGRCWAGQSRDPIVAGGFFGQDFLTSGWAVDPKSKLTKELRAKQNNSSTASRTTPHSERRENLEPYNKRERPRRGSRAISRVLPA